MNLAIIAPEITVIVIACLLIAVDLVLPAARRAWLGYLAAALLIIPLAMVVGMMGSPAESTFGGALVVDQMAIFFKMLFLIAAGVVLLSSVQYVRRVAIAPAEYYALVLFSTAGMMFLAGTRELISIYVALELTSIALYILAGFVRGDPKSGEAGIKYLLLGALSSAGLLYGMALLYGLSGSTMLDQIANALRSTGASPAAVLALVFVLVGFGFKIAAVPFHMWAPDVYEGAPTPATAFLSVGSKAAGFVIILRVFGEGFLPLNNVWPAMFAVLSAVTMTLGNVVAMRQDNVKRMLAYSSIAQAGYAMMALAAMSPGPSPTAATASLMAFLLAYAVTNLGTFAAVIGFFEQIGSDQIADYGGLARRAPLVALGLTLCLLSLAGIPPMVGFFSKIYLFSAVADRGLWWLVVLGLLNSAASIYYYVRVAKAMYLGTPSSEAALPVSFSARAALALSVAGVLLVGIFFSLPMQAAQVAATALFP